MKVRLALIPLVTSIVIGCNDIALAQSQKFHNPTLTIRREDGSITLPFNIAGCVDSDRYQNVCGEDARAVTAAEACKLKGYSNWVRYEVTDLGWRNRKDQWVWKETSQGGWFVIEESSFMFTHLECSSAPSMRVTICNRISSTATFFLNSELKSMAGGNCGGYTLPAGSTFKTSYSKNGQRIQVLVNLEGVTYDLVKHPSGDIELRRR